jgi:hypothetical protein
VSPDPHDQIGGRCGRVGCGEIVNGQLKPLKDAASDIAGLSAAGEFKRSDLVTSVCGIPGGCAVLALHAGERDERAVSAEHLVNVCSEFS